MSTPQITMYELEKNSMPLHEAVNKLREKARIMLVTLGVGE